MSRVRVLLADDHQPTLQCWCTLLEREFDVVGAVSDGRALVDADDCLEPDVIVTDIGLPLLNGLAAAELILRRHPRVRIVFATVYADRMMLRKGIAAGAFGYVLKVRVGEDLIAAVRAAQRGDLLISPFPPLAETPRS